MSETIKIVIVPGPPELTFEERLAKAGTTDKGVMDLAECVWPTQMVSFYSQPPVTTDLMTNSGPAMSRVEVMPIPREEPRRASPRAENSWEAYEEATPDQERRRGYQFAKRLGTMDPRNCRGDTESFLRGCVEGMLEDQAEFQRDYR